ncbi:MAG: hypothetical protein J0I20_34020 [Chloroflexi bacterium]|nr:hypothetical protein [Chloroflexota bacterium]OJW05587.1 MAG: hypothetical protein BGO39_02940 [Chloroflexi bacterium 54-19]
MTASVKYKDFEKDWFTHSSLELPFNLTLGGAPLTSSQLQEIWFTAKLSDEDDDPGIFQVTKTDGDIIVIDDPNGEYLVVVPAALTSGITAPTTLYCDIKTKEVLRGRVIVGARGIINMYPTPTQAV